MAKQNKRTITQSAPKTAPKEAKSKVKVLYQNLGGTWYAFADVNDSIFVGKVNMSAKEAPKAAAAADTAPKKRAPEKQAA